MAPRISRSSVQSSKPRSTGRLPKKAQKRALDAFSIASHENPDRLKIRKHRLGESDLASHRLKRRRHDDEEDEEEDEEPSEAKRRKQKSDGQDDLTFDEGSDSEGNHWTLGQVDEDDDSDIDSDEAFGESDEERFEGWTFRGGSTKQKSKKPQARKGEEADEDESFDLDEGDSADGEDEDDEDDLGEDAIDLATALDQYEESEEEEKPKKSKKSKKKQSVFDDSEPSEEEDFAADGASDFSASEDDEADPDKVAQLKHLISSLPEEEELQPSLTRRVEAHESSAPSEFGVSSKINIDLLKRTITDSDRKKSLKLLQDDLKPSKRNDIARKLDAPLPKRQQDKLDRAAANEKANETLGRWVDTVKQNRRAEHLSFPLKHPNAGESMGESRLVPTTTTAPANDLESTIQDILKQSGLSNGKDDEEQFQKWEQLQTNKLPLGEVAKRRARLRMERELLFREEVRAKRIKKIKSKAYRRVHRKERERLLQREKDALRADGVDVSEDEREYNGRRRAEERMGAKHRESKWAKGVKQSGKAAWDEDARAGVTEMARRNEELRRRIEGKEIREEDNAASDLSSENEDEDEDEDGDQVIQRQLGRLDKNPFSIDNSKLGSMAFMQKAEAARRARNDEDVERMRRELAGEDSQSEDENENSARVGRKKFGPGNKTAAPAIQVRGEFEEADDREEDEDAEPTAGAIDDAPSKATNGLSNVKRKGKSTKSKSAQHAPAMDATFDNPYLSQPTKEDSSENPYLSGTAKEVTSGKLNAPKPAKETKPAKEKKNKSEKSKQEKSPRSDVLSSAIVSKPDDDGFQTVLGYDDEAEDDIENEGVDLDVVLRNQQLTAKGFAGDQDIEAEFQAEKKAMAKDQSDKVITTTLPGWGGWVGEGLNDYDKKSKGQKTVTKEAGVNQKDRADFRLDKVIINEKKNKKNTKFLASSLPFPFETREQYERSLRLPKGPEWTTKQTFQNATKPRVLVKQGIIRPMSKPMV